MLHLALLLLDCTHHCTGCHLCTANLRSPIGAPALQVASVLLTDRVPFRFNWPRSSDLRINNMQYRPYTRNNTTQLGDNARDEPATVSQMISASGRNRVALACIEEREPFCEHSNMLWRQNFCCGSS